jgi:hypothetical protein
MALCTQAKKRAGGRLGGAPRCEGNCGISEVNGLRVKGVRGCARHASDKGSASADLSRGPWDATTRHLEVKFYYGENRV